MTASVAKWTYECSYILLILQPTFKTASYLDRHFRKKDKKRKKGKNAKIGLRFANGRDVVVKHLAVAKIPIFTKPDYTEEKSKQSKNKHFLGSF